MQENFKLFAANKDKEKCEPLSFSSILGNTFQIYIEHYTIQQKQKYIVMNDDEMMKFMDDFYLDVFYSLKS